MTFTTRPTLRGTFGMASSTHWIAAQSAMGVLERGGNAFDAAVAAGFVLHVVEPHQCGPGGEVPAIIATAAEPRPRVLCGQGPAPAGATSGHYRDLGLDLVPSSGLLAAAIPGAVDAWLLLLRDHGTWSLRDVLGPAIGYARHGCPLRGVSSTLAGVSELFREHWPTSAAQWLPGGKPPADGAIVANPAYADTLDRLATEAAAVPGDRETRIDGARRMWREGFVAEAIEDFVHNPVRDSSGRDHAGVLTGDDLAGWSAGWEEPTLLDWCGFTIAKTGPWGQGPVLLQMLAIVEALGDPADLDLTGAADIHTLTEIAKLAFADREAWYGDSGDVPLQTLLSASYAAGRARLVGPGASADLRPGSPDGRGPRLPTYVRAQLAGASEPPGTAPAGTPPGPPGGRHGDTAHIDVVDRWGNILAAMPSGGWLQSSPLIPGLGFPLGTRLQITWLEEGLPSSLTPGRRPRTTLSPTMVLRDGRPLLAGGSPGGDQQDQWQLPFLLRRLTGGYAIQEAIDAPTWHTASFPSSFDTRLMQPGSLFVEDRLGDGVLADLERRGHRVSRAGAWSLGHLCAVGREHATGMLSAGANPRGMLGYAAGR